MANELPELTELQTAALQAFADENGRFWKTVLNNVYWYNARIWRGQTRDGRECGYVLHSLRNSHGPRWLEEQCTIKPRAPFKQGR